MMTVEEMCARDERLAMEIFHLMQIERSAPLYYEETFPVAVHISSQILTITCPEGNVIYGGGEFTYIKTSNINVRKML